MKKLIFLFVLTILLSGCIGSFGAQIKPAPERVKAMEKIAVIPMEPPPLDISPLIPMDKLLVSGLGTSTQMAMVPESSIQTAGGIGNMVFGIFMLAELPEARKKSVKIAKSLEDMFNSEGAWIPTIILAEEVSSQINLSGFHKGIATKNLYKYPGLTDREATWHLQNWQGPMRDWYTKEISPFEYSSYIAQGIDGVLEVALVSYCLDYGLVTGGSLGMYIYIKLIDPATGKVLGRAKGDVHGVRTGPLENLFENNAERFKKLFVTHSKEIVRKELEYLEILPKT